MEELSITKKIEIQDKSFNLKQTLECGQCFRQHKIGDNKYIVIAHGKMLRIEQDKDTITLYTSEEDFQNIWKNYFDLDTDYDFIKECLCENDLVMRDACEYAPGIRILNQDIFECMISFIISQNSNIPKIMIVIKNLSRMFGEKICSLDGVEYYSFPTSSQLSNATEQDFKDCKAGFRARYILDAVTKVNSGELDLKTIANMPTQNAKELLMTVKGIGEKVSDCILLFSCKKTEVFPTDVWIRRVMQYFYFKNMEDDASIQQIHELARAKFGKYAGYAQEYLFYYARQFQIGKGKQNAKEN